VGAEDASRRPAVRSCVPVTSSKNCGERGHCNFGRSIRAQKRSGLTAMKPCAASSPQVSRRSVHAKYLLDYAMDGAGNRVGIARYALRVPSHVSMSVYLLIRSPWCAEPGRATSPVASGEPSLGAWILTTYLIRADNWCLYVGQRCSTVDVNEAERLGLEQRNLIKNGVAVVPSGDTACPCAPSRLGHHLGRDAAGGGGGVALYARVSSGDQRADLDRQLARLALHAVSLGWRVTHTACRRYLRNAR
jgi:hypothetical protein